MVSKESKLIQRNVGAGEIVVSDNGGHVLTAFGLGSCVGVIAFDTEAGIGGMAHIKLPDSTQVKFTSAQSNLVFADIGIPELFQRMENMGVSLGNLSIVLVGGAQVGTENDMFKIGFQNKDACLQILKRYGLTVREKRLGGASWRSVRLFIHTGQISIQSQAKEIEMINMNSGTNELGFEENTANIRTVKDIEKVFSHLAKAEVPKKRTRQKLKSVDEIKQLLAPLVNMKAKDDGQNPGLFLAENTDSLKQLIPELTNGSNQKLIPKRTQKESKRLKEIFQILANFDVD